MTKNVFFVISLSVTSVLKTVFVIIVQILSLSILLQVYVNAHKHLFKVVKLVFAPHIPSLIPRNVFLVLLTAIPVTIIRLVPNAFIHLL